MRDVVSLQYSDLIGASRRANRASTLSEKPPALPVKDMMNACPTGGCN